MKVVPFATMQIALFALLAAAAVCACDKRDAANATGDAATFDAGVLATNDSRGPRAALDASSPRAEPSIDLAANAGPMLAQFLPEKAGRFDGGPLEIGTYYARRKYADAYSHLEVTISDSRSARVRLTPKGEPSDFFLRESAAYPQIALDIPKGTGSGFYDCADHGQGERCSGYIMLFDGFHIEALNGDATRAEVDRLLAALPLRKLATLR